MNNLDVATEKARFILQNSKAGISYIDHRTGNVMVYGKKKLYKKIHWKFDNNIQATNVVIFDQFDRMIWSSPFDRLLSKNDQLTLNLDVTSIKIDDYVFIMGELLESELVQKTLF